MSLILSDVKHPHHKGGSLKVGAGKTFENRINGRPAKSQLQFEAHQAITHAHVRTVRTHTIDAGYAATCFTGGNNEVKLRIRENSMTKQLSTTIRFKITETGAATMILLPVYQWFQRIELWSKNGSGEELIREYGETFEEKNILSHSEEELKPLCDLVNRNARGLINYTASTHKASESKWYSLPLSDLLAMINPNHQKIKGDLLIRFYCKNGIVASGSGVPSLVDVNLVAEEEDLLVNGFDHADEHGKSLIRGFHAYQYFEPVIVEETNTLTASTKYRLNLENITGAVAALTVRIRSSTAATASAVQKYVDLGPQSLFDVESNTGTSLWANGTAVFGDYLLRDLPRKYANNDFCNKNKLYIVPFCDNFVNAIVHGVNHGFMNFKEGAKNYLAITPDANPTSAVYSIDITGTPASGSCYFVDPWGNRTADLAYDATAATVQTALNALPFYYENGLTSTVSASPFGGDFTVTFAGIDPEVLLGRPLGFFSALYTSAPALVTVASVTQSTIPRRGFTTGSYTVTVYGWVLRNVLDIGSNLVKAN